MKRWTVEDRAGRTIYMTEERWQHIISGHSVLENHLKDVLDALRFGNRTQDALRPSKYFYRNHCDGLPGFYNRITVVVMSRPDNRYVVTAWPEVTRE